VQENSGKVSKKTSGHSFFRKHSEKIPLELSVYELSARHDVRDLVVKTLLTYLELEGILQPTGAIYTQYKFQPQRPSAEILGRFNPARAKFIGDIFRQSKAGKTWFSIDVAQAALTLAQPILSPSKQ